MKERNVERKQYQFQNLERYQEAKENLSKEIARDVVKEKSLYLQEKELDDGYYGGYIYGEEVGDW